MKTGSAVCLAKDPTKKDFVLAVLEYGLNRSQFTLIGIKDVVLKYNGGGNWNSAYEGDWYDLYLPIKLSKHKVVTKDDMKGGEPPLYTLAQFDELLIDVQRCLRNHYKILSSNLSIGNDMLYVEFSVNPC